MLKIYKLKLIPSAKRMFHEIRQWDLQEDNDTKHTARICSQWKLKNLINRINWPSNSPDLNPIENVWGLIKTQLAGKTFHSTNHFIYNIRKIWNNFSQEYAQALVLSMPKRIKEVICNNGDWILY